MRDTINKTDQPMHSLRFVLALLATVILAACDGDAPAETPADSSRTADLVYSGGHIVTLDPAIPAAEAVAVRDGLIVGVGTLAQLQAQIGPTTERVDLAGQTMTPGFIDGHAHVAQFGVQAVGANLLAPPDGQTQNIDDLVAALQAFAASPEVARTGWIYGLGYDDSILAEGRHPTREDLDRVSTELPVIAVHISGHFGAVNSKALAMVGYSADTPDPAGGVIRRIPGSTEPNGVLEELASIPVMMQALSPRNQADAEFFLRKGLELAMSYGYTTAHEGRAFAPTHDMLAAFADTHGLPIDVVSYIDYTEPAPLESVWHSRQYRNGYRVGGMKITLDGSPQGRTAWRTEPYLLPPEGQNADYLGYPAIADEEAQAAVAKAYSEDWQVIVHANGDAAIDQMLAAVRAAAQAHGEGDRRTTLIHGQYVRQDQLEQMVPLQITASLFPMHTFYWGDWHKQIIGETLGNRISPMRAALDLGLPVTSHSDAPVALPNLMQVMWATVNRVSRSGAVIGADQRLTPLEALQAITLWSARQHFEEDSKGSIEVGKRADLVVLSDNPLSIDPMKINQIEVMTTIKDGREVWRRQANN